MILLVGTSVRALMESAAESGCEVMGIDFFGDVDAGWQGKMISLTRDCGLKPTVKNLLETARTVPCHGFAYASGPENLPEGLVYWEKQNLLRGNGSSVLNDVRNPWRIRQSLEKIGARMPAFSGVGKGQQDPGKRWLLKPLNRGGGHGIVELPEKQERSQVLMASLPNPEKYILEEFIEGIPCSVTFLADGKEAKVLSTSRQLIGRGRPDAPFSYQGNIVPLDLGGTFDAQVLADEIAKIIAHLTKDFGLKGLNTLDFMVNKQGIWVLEINPRWSASVELIERYLGKRLFTDHLAACQGELLPDEVYQRKASGFFGKVIIYAKSFMVIKNYQEDKLRFLYRQGVRDIPIAGTQIGKGQPLCTVLAEEATDLNCQLSLMKKSDWVLHYMGGPECCLFHEETRQIITRKAGIL